MPGATLDISEARKQLNTLDKKLEDQRVIVVTRHNKRAFAVVNLEYLSALIETLEIFTDPEATQMLNDSVADLRAARVVDHGEVEKEIG